MMGAGAGPRMRTEAWAVWQSPAASFFMKSYTAASSGPRAINRTIRPNGGTPNFCALGQLAADEPFVVMQHRVADRRVIGAISLHQHATRPIAATRAAGHLGHQLEGTLGGAKVRQVQRRVGVDHPHERHVGEIESLGDHLGAQQNVHPPALKSARTSS